MQRDFVDRIVRFRHGRDEVGLFGPLRIYDEVKTNPIAREPALNALLGCSVEPCAAVRDQ